MPGRFPKYLHELPAPPLGKSGWPWTEICPSLPAKRPDGSDWPPISIVTPSLNHGEHLEGAIRSALLQGYPNLEYNIIDGGSTDETIAIIEKYQPFLNHWVSEEDNGPAHAINKGLAKSSGLWFYTLNADDLLNVGALTAAGSSPVSAQILCGAVRRFSREVDFVLDNQALSVEELLWDYTCSSWAHAGLFFKRQLLADLGGYAEEFQHCYDLYLTCTYLEHVRKVQYLDCLIASLRIHPRSKKFSLERLMKQESVCARAKLSETLKRPRHRRLARKEVRRSELHDRILTCLDEDKKVTAMTCIRFALTYPYLLADRFFITTMLNLAMFGG